MSEAAFQSAFARLVTDTAFRDQFRESATDSGLAGRLTRRELGDLHQLACSPGLDVMRKLHLGFRLNKLFSALPLTCRLLGDSRMAAEAARFWKSRPSSTFYFLEEAEAFSGYLYARLSSGLRVPYLADVLAYESALLILKRPRRPESPALAVTVTFRFDPQLLLSSLQTGRRPHAVPRRKTALLGSLDEGGDVRWTLSPSRA